MAYRGRPQSYSSINSQNSYSDPYDPYDPPGARIEMSDVSPRRSHGDISPIDERAASPDDIALRDHPQESYFPADRDNEPSSSYTQLPEHGEGQTKTFGSGAGADSVYTVHSLANYKTMDADTQALVDRRAGEIAQWRIHWQTPAFMISLFFLGIMASMGHHLFYASLDGKPAKDQVKMVRYGTALAFFVKSTLVGSVILAYRQRIWHTFRRKALTITAIDGLFSATEDPTQFWNWEMIRNGKLATFMAACSWLIPLSSVLSPASLTSELQTSHEQAICGSVATLNFSRESIYNFRKESEHPGTSLAYYNTTDVNASTAGWFDYYDQPAKVASRLTITSAFLRKPATYTNASIDSCGQGYNCTYSLNFQGPGYKCEEIANSSYPNPDDTNAPWNISALAPLDDYLYKADVDRMDYARPQVDSDQFGQPINKSYPDSLGVFQAEPVLWIGYVVNTTKPYDSSSPYAKQWINVQEPHIFKCEGYHTNYTFEMQFQDGVQNATRKQRDFLKPIVDTTVTPVGENQFKASPSSNYVLPNTDVGLYKLTTAYHAMGALLRNFLKGDITYTDGGVYQTHSDISETRLVQPTSYTVTDLMDELHSVYEDMIITLLSEPSLMVADKASVPCVKSKTGNVYNYRRENLWVGYAISVAVTLLFVLIGGYSIWQNGVASDTQFSRIMVTTRNPTIDRLSVGACLGGDPFPKELTQTKLRFGVLLEQDPREGPFGKVEHCTFGTAGETKEIVKFGTYAGLRQYRKDVEEMGVIEEKELLLSRQG